MEVDLAVSGGMKHKSPECVNLQVKDRSTGIIVFSKEWWLEFPWLRPLLENELGKKRIRRL